MRKKSFWKKKKWRKNRQLLQYPPIKSSPIVSQPYRSVHFFSHEPRWFPWLFFSSQHIMIYEFHYLPVKFLSMDKWERLYIRFRWEQGTKGWFRTARGGCWACWKSTWTRGKLTTFSLFLPLSLPLYISHIHMNVASISEPNNTSLRHPFSAMHCTWRVESPCRASHNSHATSNIYSNKCTGCP